MRELRTERPLVGHQQLSVAYALIGIATNAAAPPEKGDVDGVEVSAPDRTARRAPAGRPWSPARDNTPSRP